MGTQGLVTVVCMAVNQSRLHRYLCSVLHFTAAERKGPLWDGRNCMGNFCLNCSNMIIVSNTLWCSSVESQEGQIWPFGTNTLGKLKLAIKAIYSWKGNGNILYTMSMFYSLQKPISVKKQLEVLPLKKRQLNTVNELQELYSFQKMVVVKHLWDP